MRLIAAAVAALLLLPVLGVSRLKGFPVLSDFWPHGAVAERYGVLRSEGVSERALFIVDQRGLIRYIEVSDINRRPDLETCIDELEKLEP